MLKNKITEEVLREKLAKWFEEAYNHEFIKLLRGKAFKTDIESIVVEDYEDCIRYELDHFFRKVSMKIGEITEGEVDFMMDIRWLRGKCLYEAFEAAWMYVISREDGDVRRELEEQYNKLEEELFSL